MLPSFDATITALIPKWPALPPAKRVELSANCAALVRAQLARAPFYIRFGFEIMFFAFKIYALLNIWRERDLSAAISRFSNLPLPMVAALERMLRTMTILAYLEQADVLAAIGEETPHAKQESFRAKRAVLLG